MLPRQSIEVLKITREVPFRWADPSVKSSCNGETSSSNCLGLYMVTSSEDGSKFGSFIHNHCHFRGFWCV